MEEFTIALPGGVSLSAAERPGADAGLPPVVMLHGFLDSWRSWSRVLPCLKAPGRRVISITHRGWGDSDKTGAYTIDAYAADIVAALHALSIEQAVLVGHSMGTIISTAVAARHPAMVASLVLCGAAAKIRPEVVLDPAEGVTLGSIGDMLNGFDYEAGGHNAFIESFQLDDLHPFIDDGRVEPEFAAQVMSETRKGDFRAYKEAFADMLKEDHTGELAGLPVPTLIIWGTEDIVLPYDDQQQLLSLLSNASLVRVEGAPHGVIWTHASEVAAHIDTFLARGAAA